MSDDLPNFIGDGGRGVESMPVIVPEVRFARRWYAITPSGATLDPPVKAVWVNQACTITLENADGDTATFTMDGAGAPPVVPTKVTAISAGTVLGLHD